MVAIARSTILDAPIAAVWQVLRDFNSHLLWHPRVIASEIEHGLPADVPGCIRHFRLSNGAELREQLIALSDRDHGLTYCILDSPLALVDYVATIRLRPVTDGNRTFWDWRSSFHAPAAQVDVLARVVAHDIYAAGFEGLRRFLADGGAVPELASTARTVPAPSRATLEVPAIILRQYGGAEHLVPGHTSVPRPGPGEVRLRHTAIGVNYLDIYVRTGQYPLIELPGILGVEAAGQVTDVGEGVAHILPGDRVAYACLPPGSYAAARTMAAGQLVVLPPAIDDEVAAGAMLKGMTAEYLLHRTHRVVAGDIVLVHAAAGGVGLLLCQWAKHIGATVIGTVGTPEKARLARAAGCDYPITGSLDDFANHVKDITGGRGANVIFDGIGRASFDGSFAALAMRGHLILYGQATGLPDPIAHEMLAAKSATVTRPVLFHYTADPAELRSIAHNLFRMIESGGLTVSINQRFRLSEAADAQRALEERRTSGSTILLV